MEKRSLSRKNFILACVAAIEKVLQTDPDNQTALEYFLRVSKVDPQVFLPTVIEHNAVKLASLIR